MTRTGSILTDLLLLRCVLISSLAVARAVYIQRFNCLIGIFGIVALCVVIVIGNNSVGIYFANDLLTVTEVRGCEAPFVVPYGRYESQRIVKRMGVHLASP